MERVVVRDDGGIVGQNASSAPGAMRNLLGADTTLVLQLAIALFGATIAPAVRGGRSGKHQRKREGELPVPKRDHQSTSLRTAAALLYSWEALTHTRDGRRTLESVSYGFRQTLCLQSFPLCTGERLKPSCSCYE